MPGRRKKGKAKSEKKEEKREQIKKAERHDHLKAAHELMLRRKQAEKIKTKKYI